jgi:hypothetical protein
LNRRSFIALASGLLVPWEPERVYSFLPAWRLVSRWVFESGHLPAGAIVLTDPELGYGAFRSPLHTHPAWTAPHGFLFCAPENLLDVQKSAEAYGIRDLVFPKSHHPPLLHTTPGNAVRDVAGRVRP